MGVVGMLAYVVCVGWVAYLHGWHASMGGVSDVQT